MKFTEEIQTAHAYFGLREDGIIVSRILSGKEGNIELHEALEIDQAMRRLCRDGAKPLLAHMGDNHLVDDARRHLIENICVSMAALIGTTFFARMMANLIMNFKKLPVPMKLFADEESAMSWIEEQQRLQNKDAKKVRA